MPRAFVFPLDPVLDQRTRAEERAQVELAKVEKQRIDCEDTIRSLQRELLETRSLLRDRLHPAARPGAGGPLSASPPGIAGARLAASASLHLVAQAQAAVMQLAGILKRHEAARAELLRASSARKAVQLLKDRALDEHRRAAHKRELAEVDELVVMRHGRTGEPGGPSLSSEHLP